MVAAWLRIIDAATLLADAHVIRTGAHPVFRRWMKRRRVLNSLIVMLFVFRLVLSPGTLRPFQSHRTRLLPGHGDGLLVDMRKHGKERQAVNFRNAIAVVAANIEETLLAQADAVARVVTRMAEGILKVGSRLRPGRSYPRRSMKPASKWNRRSKAAA